MLSALTINPLTVSVGCLSALLSAASFSLFGKGRPRPFFAHGEYWIYLPGEEMPSQDALMHRMLRGNPHRNAGKTPVGKNEALIFSDVRLHIALVLRSRNAHVFRPDLFSEHVEPTAPMLEGLAGAKSFAKVRFISEEPLKDMRHLRFLAYAADAIAELGNGSVIFDVVAEKLYSPAEFGEKLDALGDATDADFQTDVVWSRSAAGGIAETRGLEKVGLPELATEEMNTDQRVLVTAILEGVIRQVWTLDTLPPAADVNYFDDHYRVEIKQTRKGPAKVTLMRMPS